MSKEIKSLGINTEASSLFTLAAGIYSYPELSSVKEICSNGIDAFADVKHLYPKSKIGLKINLLINHNTYYMHVKDYGHGIPPDKFHDVFCTLSKSTKKSNNNSTGKFGLGSKSPFAVTDNYWVKNTCINDGESIYYSLIHNDSDIGVIDYTKAEYNVLSTHNNFYTDNIPGLEICWNSKFKLDVSKHDIILYLSLLNESKNIQVNLHGDDIKYFNFKFNKYGKHLVLNKSTDIEKSSFFSGSIYLYQGSDVLRVDELISNDKRFKNIPKFWTNNQIIFLRCKNKKFNVNISRESLTIKDDNERAKLIDFLISELVKLNNSLYFNKINIFKQESKANQLTILMTTLLNGIYTPEQPHKYNVSVSRYKNELRYVANSSHTVRIITPNAQKYKSIITTLCLKYTSKSYDYVLELMDKLFSNGINPSLLLPVTATNFDYRHSPSITSMSQANINHGVFIKVLYEFLSLHNHNIYINSDTKLTFNSIKSKINKTNKNKITLFFSQSSKLTSNKFKLQQLTRHTNPYITYLRNQLKSRYNLNAEYYIHFINTHKIKSTKPKTIKVKKLTKAELNNKLISKYNDSTTTTVKSIFTRVVNDCKAFTYNIDIPIPILIVPFKVPNSILFETVCFNISQYASDDYNDNDNRKTIFVNNCLQVLNSTKYFKKYKIYNSNESERFKSELIKNVGHSIYTNNSYFRNGAELSNRCIEVRNYGIYKHVIIINEEFFIDLCKYLTINKIDLKFKIHNTFLKNKKILDYVYDRNMYTNIDHEHYTRFIKSSTSTSLSLRPYGIVYGWRNKLTNFTMVNLKTPTKGYINYTPRIIKRSNVKNDKVLNYYSSEKVKKILRKTINIEKKYLHNAHTKSYISRTYL